MSLIDARAGIIDHANWFLAFHYYPLLTTVYIVFFSINIVNLPVLSGVKKELLTMVETAECTSKSH